MSFAGRRVLVTGGSRGIGRATAEAFAHAGAAVGFNYARAEDAGEAEEALAALRRAGGGPSGWRARVETANANAMLPGGALRTSATSLAPYENCPLQFFLGSLLRLERTRTAGCGRRRPGSPRTRTARSSSSSAACSRSGGRGRRR